MANGRLFHYLSVLWLGLAVVCLIGHYVADAANLGCQANLTGICQDEDSSTYSLSPDENVAGMILFHAGFNLPSIISVAVSPMLTLAIIILILPPVAVKPPVLSPPPQ